MNRNWKGGSYRKWGRSVARKVLQDRFLTFVALLKSSLGQRFVLDGDFPGNHSMRGNNANSAQFSGLGGRAQQVRDEGASRGRNGIGCKKYAATEAAAL